jgi:hypothetical protein
MQHDCAGADIISDNIDLGIARPAAYPAALRAQEHASGFN